MKSCSNLIACLLVFALPLGANLRGQQPSVGPTPELPINTGGEVAATTAIEVWLGLLDDGQFAQAWESGAKILQNLVTEKDWLLLAKAKRPPLGKVIARKKLDATPAQTFPGAPAGQYVVVRYNTEFEHKKVAMETVTAVLDPASGQWKVCGYYVR